MFSESNTPWTDTERSSIGGNLTSPMSTGIKTFNFDPNKFNVEGFGWDRPSDATDPDNHAQNRRVEVKIFTAEQG